MKPVPPDLRDVLELEVYLENRRTKNEEHRKKGERRSKELENTTMINLNNKKREKMKEKRVKRELAKTPHHCSCYCTNVHILFGWDPTTIP